MHNLRINKDFIAHKALIIKKKIDILDFVKTKSDAHLKDKPQTKKKKIYKVPSICSASYIKNVYKPVLKIQW